jgi:hypothetical protein
VKNIINRSRKFEELIKPQAGRFIDLTLGLMYSITLRAVWGGKSFKILVVHFSKEHKQR